MPIIEERYYSHQEMASMILDTITTTDSFEANYKIMDNRKTINFRFSRKESTIGISFGNNKFQYNFAPKAFDKESFFNFITFVFDHIEGIITENWRDKNSK